jgi:hypothetical protein
MIETDTLNNEYFTTCLQLYIQLFLDSRQNHGYYEHTMIRVPSASKDCIHVIETMYVTIILSSEDYGLVTQAPESR